MMELTSNVPEREMIEWCLMMRHSGYEYMHILGLHALAEGWHINKLFYYLDIIENE